MVKSRRIRNPHSKRSTQDSEFAITRNITWDFTFF